MSNNEVEVIDVLVDLTADSKPPARRRKTRPGVSSAVSVDDDDDEVVVVSTSRKVDEEVTVFSPSVASVPTASQAHSAAAGGGSNSDYAMALKLAAQEPSLSQMLPKRRRGVRFTCNICLEDELEAFKGYSIQACGHRFCIECLTGMVQSAMGPSASHVLKIICPQDKCSCSLSFNDVQYILRNEPAAWKQYSEKASMSSLESEVLDAASHTRRCPSQHCNFIFSFVRQERSAEGRQFDCPSCRDSYCLQCGANGGKVGPSHPGMTCADRLEEIQKKEEERRKFEAWKAENSKADERFNELMDKERKKGNTKPCPKCKTPITKNGGCNHMYCIQCKTHFNWGDRSKAPSLMPGMNV